MSVQDYANARSLFLEPTTSKSKGKSPSENIESDGYSDSEDQLPSKALRVEFADITEKQKYYGRSLIALTHSRHQSKEDRGAFDDYALVLRRKINKNDELASMKLEVRSPIIRKALKTPYDALFHFRDEIRQYATATERTEEERRHMSILTEFMARNIGQTEKLWEQLVPNHRITFALLWILFRAEDDVVVHTDHYREVYRVISGQHKVFENGTSHFEIQAWRWGFNGTKFGPTKETLIIPEFSSTQLITQLPVFPVKRLPQREQEALYAKLVVRGLKWKSLVGPAHRQYDGPVWEHAQMLPFASETSRIILDDGLFVQTHPGFADVLIGASEFVGDENAPMRFLSNVRCFDNNTDYVMSDEQAWLCPSRSRGFSLSSKSFLYFLVDKIKKVDFKDDAFSYLELNPVIKETIYALVETHNSSADVFDDFVANKGKGIIISLEGSPGSGKTLTAESVAELTHKPLYVIGTGELGSEARIAEPALKAIFDRARAWDAVLLLDEADLFLSKRTENDMERNAFVTIFLRLLEYYQGILFLTTNRVEEYDPAFSSRIHLKVHFSAPNGQTRASIWRNPLRSINDCKDWDSEVFDRLGHDLELNGREIKNLIKPALAIARHEKKPMTEAVVRRVYKIINGTIANGPGGD